MSILTPRLLLEPYTVAHAEQMLSGPPADAGAGGPWADGYPFADELDVARLYLRIVAEHGDPEPFGPYVMRLRETAEAIGGLGFFGPPDAATGVVEFGYGLVPTVRGAGLATEAVIAALELAAGRGVRVARADTTPENVASQRVMEKAGMTEVSRTAASVVFELGF